MVILGGLVFLMSEEPLYGGGSYPKVSEFGGQIDSHDALPHPPLYDSVGHTRHGPPLGPCRFRAQG